MWPFKKPEAPKRPTYNWELQSNAKAQTDEIVAAYVTWENDGYTVFRDANGSGKHLVLTVNVRYIRRLGKVEA